MRSVKMMHMVGLAALFLACLLCPVGIVLLGEQYGFDRLATEEDYSPWIVVAIDSLFWADAGCSTALLWLLRRWWLFAMLVLVPLVCVTGVLAVFNGIWVEGTYF